MESMCGNDPPSSPPVSQNAFSVLMSKKSSTSNSYTRTRSTPQQQSRRGSDNQKVSCVSSRKPKGVGRKRNRENDIFGGNLKTPTSSSKFVECPSCNLLVAYATIHIHLDQCLAADDTEKRNKKVTDAHNHVNDSNKDCMGMGDNVLFGSGTNHNSDTDTNDINVLKKQNPIESDENENENEGENDETRRVESATTATKIPEQNNAFRHMMRHSKGFYEQQRSQAQLKQTEQQWFHLTEQGDVKWLRTNDNIDVSDLNVKWSSSSNVSIRASKDKHVNGGVDIVNTRVENDIELHITSSISPDLEYQPLVQRTSKFSVSFQFRCPRR